MQQSRGKPVLGAVLGAVLGVIGVLILQQGAIALPTRLVVFGVIGVATSAGSLLLTVAHRKPAVVVIHSLAVLSIAFALTGIPALSAGGALSGPCTVSATMSSGEAASSGETASQGEAVGPADTSASHPLDIDPTGTLDWRVAFPEPYETWSGTIGTSIAGFRLPIWTQRFDNTERESFREGREDVRSDMREVEDVSGLSLTGVYHVYATVDAPGDSCAADMYVRIAPENLFSAPILQGLWTCAAIAALVFAAYVVQVRRNPDAETPNRAEPPDSADS